MAAECIGMVEKCQRGDRSNRNWVVVVGKGKWYASRQVKARDVFEPSMIASGRLKGNKPERTK